MASRFSCSPYSTNTLSNEAFQKIIIVGDDIKPKTDEQGIKTIGLFDFLLDSKSLDI